MKKLTGPSILLLAGAMIASPVLAKSCGSAVAHCKQEGSRNSDAAERCAAAGAQCARTGTFTGPYTGRTYRGFAKQ